MHSCACNPRSRRFQATVNFQVGSDEEEMITGFGRKQGVQQLTKEKPFSYGISSSRLGSNLLGHVGKSSDLVSRTDQGDVCAQETSNVSKLCWTFPANYIQLNPTHV